MKTDFKTWERERLEKFARDAADENRELRQQVNDLLRAYRAEVIRNASNEPIRKIRGKWLGEIQA